MTAAIVLFASAPSFAQKKTARIMMRLTDDINKTLDAAVPRAAGAEARVSCLTCHRGKSTPTNTKEP